jgi:hypothetical protein
MKNTFKFSWYYVYQEGWYCDLNLNENDKVIKIAKITHLFNDICLYNSSSSCVHCFRNSEENRKTFNINSFEDAKKYAQDYIIEHYFKNDGIFNPEVCEVVVK